MPKEFCLRSAFQDRIAVGIELHIGRHDVIGFPFGDEILVDVRGSEDEALSGSWFQGLGKRRDIQLETGRREFAQAVGDHGRGCFTPAMGLHDRLVLANSSPVTHTFDLFQLLLLLKGSPFARRCAVESFDFAKDLANGGQGLLLAFSLLTGHRRDEIFAR